MSQDPRRISKAGLTTCYDRISAEDRGVPEGILTLLQPLIHIDFVGDEGGRHIEEFQVIDSTLGDALPWIDKVQKVLGSEESACEEKWRVENQNRGQQYERNKG